LRFFRHLRDRRPLDNPRAWLFTVAHNLAVDKIRDETYFTTLDDAMWREDEKSQSGVDSDPDELMMRNERVDVCIRRAQFNGTAASLPAFEGGRVVQPGHVLLSQPCHTCEWKPVPERQIDAGVFLAMRNSVRRSKTNETY